MLAAICKAQPEKCFEENIELLKIMDSSVASNPDWNIRIEAAKFFQEYIPLVQEKFPNKKIDPQYIHFLTNEYGFLSDEDIDITVIGLETATDILHEFDEKSIQDLYIRNFLRAIEKTTEDGELRLCKLIGKAFDKMKQKSYNFLKENCQGLLEIYMRELQSEKIEKKRIAIFNFPAICQLFKEDFEEFFGINMQEKVFQLLSDEDHEVRMTMVRSLHEIFKLMG